ncbi:hypothetical protein F4677DRAFT_448640 [Hypoxylon crocopeplum]|nr:hypothetical protein F4677DRAFT_448640 [Hypoxylon crocopeplum]
MGFSKVAIIAAPTRDPRGAIQQSSGVPIVLAPALVAIFQCQQLLGKVSLFLCLRAQWLALQILCAGQLVANQVYVSSGSFWYHAVALARAVWRTRTIRHLRKKIEFEFFALMLGSSGNGLCLVLFWPGWWVLGLIWLAAWLRVD